MKGIKNMKFKHALIPVAAFAVTVSTASAFSGSDFIKHLNLELTDEQLKALEQAQEIREDAREDVEAVLEAAGLDKEKMREVHDALHEARKAQSEAMKTAIEDNDYAAFLAAVEGTKLGEVVDTESEFKQFITAHELIKDGDREAAKVIMDELGLEKPGLGLVQKGGHGHHGGSREGWGGRGMEPPATAGE
jgi:hypothetical protein